MDKLEQSEHNTVALQTYDVYACLIIKPSIWVIHESGLI